MTGITNPAEVYFKDGIWAWASTLWEKLISSGGRLFTALHGWDGDSWQKLPMVWGYSGHIAGTVSDDNAAVTMDDLFMTACAEGEVWVIESLSARDVTTDVDLIQFAAFDGAYESMFYEANPGGIGKYVYWTGRMTLHYGDVIYAHYEGTVAGDDLYLKWWGYKMLVAE